MTNWIAATLVYDTPDLVSQMRDQVPNVWVVDNGSKEPIQGAVFRLPKNLMFTGGWKKFTALPLGDIEFSGGPATVTVTPASKPGLGVMNLKSISITPIH